MWMMCSLFELYQESLIRHAWIKLYLCVVSSNNSHSDDFTHAASQAFSVPPVCSLKIKAALKMKMLTSMLVFLKLTWGVLGKFLSVCFCNVPKHTGQALMSCLKLWFDTVTLPPSSTHWPPFNNNNLSADAPGWFATMCSFMLKKNNVLDHIITS